MKKSDSMVARVDDYLQYRRGLGYALRIEGGMLRSFARYADESGYRGPLTNELSIRWARLPTKGARLYWARRIEVLIGFANYCKVFDARTEIPPRYTFGSAHRRRAPYLYSPSQLRSLADEGTDFETVGGFKQYTHATLFGLLACTGMRISEALRLCIADVDLNLGVITVGESKRRRSRLVPIHRTARLRLSVYHSRRAERFPNAAYFFVSQSGNRLPYTTVRSTFRQQTELLGWTKSGQLPRLHDLRHTFACRVLEKWEHRPAGSEDRIDWLSRYLGHESVSDTYWYLTATPALLTVAVRKFKYPKPS
jgi:integrase